MMLTNRVYDILKWVTVIFLPAFGVLYSSLAPVWGWPYADQVSQTVMAVVVFLGIVLQISNAQYKKANPPVDSYVTVVNNQSEPSMNMLTDEAFARLVDKQ